MPDRILTVLSVTSHSLRVNSILLAGLWQGTCKGLPEDCQISVTLYIVSFIGETIDMVWYLCYDKRKMRGAIYHDPTGTIHATDPRLYG